MLGVVAMGAPLVFRTLRAVANGRFATDIVASLSIVGAVALGQPLAGLVIVLMQAGGEALEHYAEGRALAAVRALEAPRRAWPVGFAATRSTTCPRRRSAIGDTLLILPGRPGAVRRLVLDGESELDTSSLTGEPAPLRATRETRVMSGMANGFGSFRMLALAPAERSQYARIVELVRGAQASKSPLQRLADRYAVWFTPITVAVCGIAVWLTHDWMRALAILVVATPCPLILATPVAIIGGINRAARRFVIIRHGGALEALSEVNTAVFDKTGTLTVGTPMLERVALDTGFDRATVLGYAAAVERRSSHLLARVSSMRFAANASRSRRAQAPSRLRPGCGRRRRRTRCARRRAFLRHPRLRRWRARRGAPRTLGATLRAYVSVDRRLAAVLEYADRLRPDLAGLLGALAASGIRRMVLLSGDHAPIARDIAAQSASRRPTGT